MMKLSLMRDIFETVNSNWDCSIAAELLKNWNHDANWVKMWRASANAICFTRLQDEYFVLRFNSVSEKDLKDWEAEIQLLNILKSKGLHVVEPVLSKDDSYIKTNHTKWGQFHSVLFKKIPGESYEMEELRPEHFFQWGESLGQLHNTMHEESAIQSLNRMNHLELVQKLELEYPPKNSEEEKEFMWAKKWLNTLPKNNQNRGLIHYDFELDNILWQEDGIHIFDFDDALHSWYIADIAYALRGLFDEGILFSPEDKRFQEFLKGYRNKKDLFDNELTYITEFYRVGNLISMKKLERSMDLDQSSENPEWLNELIQRLTEFHHDCKNRILKYQA